MIAIYVLGLFLYKKQYKNILTHKLQNPSSNKYKHYPDPSRFKILYLALILIVFVIAGITISNVYFNQYETRTGFNQDQLRYEEIISDEINLRLGFTQEYSSHRDDSEYVAFVHKESSHNIIGDLELILSGLEDMNAYVYSWGNGGYSYEVNYTYIKNLEMTVNVYDWESDGNEVFYTKIFSFNII